MKHLNHYLFVAVAALLATACEKEEPTDQQSTFEGHWTQQLNTQSPIDITFSGNTFIWHKDGTEKVKNIGTFSYKDSLLTLIVEKTFISSAIFDPDAAEQSQPLQYKDWEERSILYSPLEYKVISLDPTYLVLKNQNNYFINKGTILYMLRGDSFQSLAGNQLNGTWQGQAYWDTDQGIGGKFKFQFNGSNYNLYQLSWMRTREDQTPHLVCRYQEGTWAHVENNLTLTPTTEKRSFYQTSTDPVQYHYYTVDANAMKSDQWVDVAPQDLAPIEWKACLIGNNLEVLTSGNVDFTLTKQ